MKYVLGIDSGGTKYLVKACDLDGNVLGQYTGDTAAHFRVSIDEMTRRINVNLQHCLDQFGGDRHDCVRLVCGTTGIDSASARRLVTAVYEGLHGFDCPILCVNDAEVAIYAATGGIGVVVISGTGSIAFGRNADGDAARSGGWPICIFGDEGSGTWIARRALHHLSLWLEKERPTSPLIEAMVDELDVASRDDLVAICGEIEAMTWRDPHLAAVVDTAAELGDTHALDLIDDAASHTFALADTVVGKLRLADDDVFRVGAWGSAIVKSRLHYAGFKRRFEEKYDNVKVSVAKEDAAMGACRMGIALLAEDKV